MSYFWKFGDCKHCGWPHHTRHDRPAKSRRWWRHARMERSWVSCCNCGVRTYIKPVFDGSDEA